MWFSAAAMLVAAGQRRFSYPLLSSARYQIFTRAESGMYIFWPGFILKAS